MRSTLTVAGPVIQLTAPCALAQPVSGGASGIPATVALPAPLDLVLRDYERAWRAGDAQGAWLRWRLVVTPHAAFYNQASFAEMRRKAALEVQRVLNGQPPRNCVNL